eukprot:CAMPEP_0177586166 /NCGR_PEP_ID=MMETSP0419_2-20121207/4918_1 /TAXON_ID=582737 /ORGANISM="Tetraselmis sp., Strain GSL018" /LENGTH=232 /DNA_ID=CAMNT_0019076021 /DNA_START=1102 /DNA_END=1799 /DNA_ORIENTATION=-
MKLQAVHRHGDIADDADGGNAEAKGGEETQTGNRCPAQVEEPGPSLTERKQEASKFARLVRKVSAFQQAQQRKPGAGPGGDPPEGALGGLPPAPWPPLLVAEGNLAGGRADGGGRPPRAEDRGRVLVLCPVRGLGAEPGRGAPRALQDRLPQLHEDVRRGKSDREGAGGCEGAPQDLRSAHGQGHGPRGLPAAPPGPSRARKGRPEADGACDGGAPEHKPGGPPVDPFQLLK